MGLDLAAGQDAGPLVARIGDLGSQNVCLAVKDDRAYLTGSDVGPVQAGGLSLLDQTSEEGVMDRSGDIDALDRLASLPRRQDRAAQCRVGPAP